VHPQRTVLPVTHARMPPDDVSVPLRTCLSSQYPESSLSTRYTHNYLTYPRCQWVPGVHWLEWVGWALWDPVLRVLRVQWVQWVQWVHSAVQSVVQWVVQWEDTLPLVSSSSLTGPSTSLLVVPRAAASAASFAFFVSWRREIHS
jgi:hypothetical protein